MVSIKFYLHSKVSKTGTRSLYMDVHLDGSGRLQQAVGESLSEKQWNHAGQKVTAKHDYQKEINQRLDRLRHKVNLHFREMLDEGQVPTGADLRRILRPVREGNKSQGQTPQPVTVKQCLETWQKEYLARKNRGVELKPGEKKKGADYARQINQIIGHMEEFRAGLKPRQLTESLWQEYLEYLYTETDIEDSTVAKHVQGWKKALKQAGLPDDPDWLRNTFAHDKILPDLFWEEVLKLAEHDYQQAKHRQAAHAFVIACQLGFRWSDLSTFQPMHLIPLKTPNFGDVLCVRKRQGKTGAPVMVPMPPLARKLYEQYEGVPIPRTRAGTAYRSDYVDDLKEAAEEAGLTRMVVVETIRNGHLTEEQKPLHQVISSHTARHTAATRVREAGGEARGYVLAQLLLGHAMPGVTGRYAHLDLVQTAESLLGAWQYYEPKKKTKPKVKTHGRTETD